MAVKVEAVLSLSGLGSITHTHTHICMCVCVFVCAEFLSQAILNMHEHLFHPQAVWLSLRDAFNAGKAVCIFKLSSDVKSLPDKYPNSFCVTRHLKASSTTSVTSVKPS